MYADFDVRFRNANTLGIKVVDNFYLNLNTQCVCLFVYLIVVRNRMTNLSFF